MCVCWAAFASDAPHSVKWSPCASRSSVRHHSILDIDTPRPHIHTIFMYLLFAIANCCINDDAFVLLTGMDSCNTHRACPHTIVHHLCMCLCLCNMIFFFITDRTRKVTKKGIYHALIVATRKEKSRADGSYIRMSNNRCVLLVRHAHPIPYHTIPYHHHLLRICMIHFLSSISYSSYVFLY